VHRKVAFIATVYRHLEAFHLPFINLLQQKGCEVHAYASPDHGKVRVQKNHVICHDVPFRRSPFHPENVKAFKMLHQSFKEERFDLIHVHTPIAGILGRWAAKMAGIPCVMYTVHGFHFFKGAPFLNWLLYYPVERWTARWTDYLITINDEDYQRAKRFPVRKEVLYVPGVGVDTSWFQFSNEAEVRRQKRQELGIHERDFVILSVAELNENKNITQLIDAVNHMKKSYGKELRTFSVKCLLAGDGDDREHLMKKAEELDLGRMMAFLGFRKDIPELMAASDVVALLSKREGLPKALLEALAAGKPIVTTDVRGNRDLVEDGVNGYVVKVGNVPKTAEAFMKMLKDENKRIQMGETNRKKAKKYDLTNILVQMEKIYDKALSDGL
jgi:glycosyltransferase involved in cell wall biosynthesis